MKILLLFFAILGGGYYASLHVQDTKTERTYAQQLPPSNIEKIKKVEAFLASYDSPLASYSAEFVRWSDAYRIDPSIIVGISGSESSFGKRYPKHTNNPFGWGFCDSCRSGKSFASVPDAIHTVVRGIATKPVYKKFQQTKKCRDLAERYLTGDRERWCGVIEMVKGKI